MAGGKIFVDAASEIKTCLFAREYDVYLTEIVLSVSQINTVLSYKSSKEFQ